MPVHDFSSQRLFIDAPMGERQSVECQSEQANYLLNVLRLGVGDGILIFNGRDGEWRARIDTRSKRTCTLMIETQHRPQLDGPDIDYLFAPLKRARLDYMIQKATELGVRRLRPVLTRRTVAERVNLDRMRANAIEAAEQCGIVHIPEIAEPVKLERALADWDTVRHLIFCDEDAETGNPIESLRRGVGLAGSSATSDAARFATVSDPAGLTPKLAVIVGPEGGFDPSERDMLLRLPNIVRISLGPRTMRADTAAIAALALVNATLGDWQ